MKYLLLISLFTFLHPLNNYSQQSILDGKNKEKKQVKTAAIKALKWYFNEENKYYPIDYLEGGEGQGDTSKPYRINFKGVDRYLNFILNTKLFSQKFTSDLLFYFKKCDSNFVAVNQYYSVPIGFEYNLITKDTDDMEVEENIYKSKISSYKRKGSTVYLSLKFNNRRTYTFILTKHNGKWLIDNINGDFQPLSSTPV
jgi:hypothetical protein